MRRTRSHPLARPVLALFLFACVAFPAQAQPTPLWDQLVALLGEAEQKQDAGFDVTMVATVLKDARGWINNDRLEEAAERLSYAEGLLAAMVSPPERNDAPVVSVSVDASAPGEPIPHLAGNVVTKSLYDEPVFQRFMEEIGPGMIQMKLFMADLNEARDNYCYLQRQGRWEETIRRIKGAGGEVMLHLRQVPERLTLVPEANTGEGDGRAPVNDLEAWKTIVHEVVDHFNHSEDTRIAYLQDIGEPNIGTNWYDPQDLLSTRPLNVLQYAEHFRATLEAALDADPQIRVGGPTLWLGKNDDAWWDGFLSDLVAHALTPGFISIHIYDPNFGIWDEGVALARRKLATYGMAHLPLSMTEWNVAGSLEVPLALQESHLNASHALMGFLRMLDTGLQHTYFQLNPVGDGVCFEVPPGRASTPGNNLLVVVDGQVLPNTSYNAFRLFSMMRDARRLPFITDDVRIQGVAGVKDDEVMVLLTYYEPNPLDLAPEAIAHTLPDFERQRTFDLTLEDLPFDAYSVEVYRIDREHSNLHTLGPAGAELEVVESGTGQGSSYQTTVTLPIYGVYMLRLRNETAVTVEDATTPAPFALAQNYPNPFNPATAIRFTLPQPAFVNLKVFDILGREVRTLLQASMTQGDHEVTFHAGDLSGGLYYYRLEAGSRIASRPMVLLK